MDQDLFFSEIELQFQKQLPFVAYRKPNQDLVKAFLQDNSELYTVLEFTESGFVFAPFDDHEETIIIPSDVSKLLVTNSIILEQRSKKLDELSKSDNSQKETHLSLVQQGVDAILKRQFQKVVLSRKEVIKGVELDPIVVFKRLLQTYHTTFVYCWYHPKIGLWLGATPETLLKVENNRFSTMALAGTQVYKGSIDVEWKDKEKKEQQFVTDFIEESLQGTVKNTQVGEPTTIKAGNLLHIQTKITGVLQNNLKNVIQKLHPTPAVCGLPKKESKAFIQLHEHYKRTYYSGYLGELNVKDKTTRNTNRRNVENNAYRSVKTLSELFVNLRSMEIINNEAHLFIGGGITKDSIPELEWEETVQKAKTIKQVLL